MADDNTIIEGNVKFRDGKKWKSRWCVMRKLSPVADCVQLEVYRDARSRRNGACSGGGGGCKAALALSTLLGCESGFTLDHHSNTLALLCPDVVAVLAFDTRERLIQWQVKVNAHLGTPRHYTVVVQGGAGGAGGGRRAGAGAAASAGPARLHVRSRRCALATGVPPRLIAVWEINHLRRYGVVEGRFCFEGGSHCGKGEGLYVLITDQAKEIERDFNLAAQGLLSPKRRPSTQRKNEGIDSPKSHKAFRPDTRLSELNTIDSSLSTADRPLYDDPYITDETGGISPYWPSAERSQYPNMGYGDTASVNETVEGTSTQWNRAGNVTLERCMSCMSKLGALSRSSTAALTPGAKHFNPAWTMDAIHETVPKDGDVNYRKTIQCDIISSQNIKTEDICCCLENAPERPPKPSKLELNLINKPALPLPFPCECKQNISVTAEVHANKIGPYENYDVPKLPSADAADEYYDTPKRLKECLSNDLFQITKNSTSNAIILKKPCGCLLKFGNRRKEPIVVESEENFQQANCPCQRVTAWAHSWIKLPYCRKNTSSEISVPNKENQIPNSISEHSALYATIDMSRKTKRKMNTYDRKAVTPDSFLRPSIDSGTIEIDEGPLANYENLNFALSLEHYENAKDLLKKAGVTQVELNAISANLNPVHFTKRNGKCICTKCGHLQTTPKNNENKDKISFDSNDEYLLMQPNAMDSELSKNIASIYTPMSPIGAQVLHKSKTTSKNQISRLLDEKSASNPTLCIGTFGDSRTTNDIRLEEKETNITPKVERVDKIDYRKRSSSADSSRFLEDVKEFDSSVDSRDSTSSIETLRNVNMDGDRTSTPCDCTTANKHSDADSSEASKGFSTGVPPAKRSSSVPGKVVGNRDSSSSNDSGVSSWSLRRGGSANEFELPLTTAAARRSFRSAQRAARAAAPRRARSTPRHRESVADATPLKSSSAEAEVPILSIKSLRGVMDTHSTSSGTSDMSDYIETLSICSSHSSTDTPVTMRVVRPTTSTLRPRSGKEYQNLDPRVTSVYRTAHLHYYTNLP